MVLCSEALDEILGQHLRQQRTFQTSPSRVGQRRRSDRGHLDLSQRRSFQHREERSLPLATAAHREIPPAATGRGVGCGHPHGCSVARPQGPSDGCPVPASLAYVPGGGSQPAGHRFRGFALPWRYRSQTFDRGRVRKCFGMNGVPRGIRTPVTAVKGRCPRPG